MRSVFTFLGLTLLPLLLSGCSHNKYNGHTLKVTLMGKTQTVLGASLTDQTGKLLRDDTRERTCKEFTGSVICNQDSLFDALEKQGWEKQGFVLTPEPIPFLRVESPVYTFTH